MSCVSSCVSRTPFTLHTGCGPGTLASNQNPFSWRRQVFGTRLVVSGEGCATRHLEPGVWSGGLRQSTGWCHTRGSDTDSGSEDTRRLAPLSPISHTFTTHPPPSDLPPLPSLVIIALHHPPPLPRLCPSSTSPPRPPSHGRGPVGTYVVNPRTGDHHDRRPSRGPHGPELHGSVQGKVSV